jgi:hypothetical protein
MEDMPAAANGAIRSDPKCGLAMNPYRLRYSYKLNESPLSTDQAVVDLKAMPSHVKFLDRAKPGTQNGSTARTEEPRWGPAM